MSPPTATDNETESVHQSHSTNTVNIEEGRQTESGGQNGAVDSDDDNLIGDDYELSSIREKRLMQLKKEIEHINAMKHREHGTYTEVRQEKELMDLTLKSKLCIVHFYHKEFRRCQIVDKHLQILAQKHFNTKFLKINVENAPFLVEKLAVQILPCIVTFVDGIAVDRLVGFEELGFTDNFSTGVLEKRLAKSGVIEVKENKVHTVKQSKSIMGKSVGVYGDDDSDDYDEDLDGAGEDEY